MHTYMICVIGRNIMLLTLNKPPHSLLIAVVLPECQLSVGRCSSPADSV